MLKVFVRKLAALVLLCLVLLSSAVTLPSAARAAVPTDLHSALVAPSSLVAQVTEAVEAVKGAVEDDTEAAEEAAKAAKKAAKAEAKKAKELAKAEEKKAKEAEKASMTEEDS
jgi:Skp family chaperone for outer membrane proteins